jgi:hypothetical protein
MVRTTPSRGAKLKDDSQEGEKPSPKTPPKKGKQAWTPDEDEALMLAVIVDRQRRQENDEEDEEEDWDEIAKSVPGKTPVNCLRRFMGQLSKKEEEAGAAPPAAAAAKRGSPDEDDDESFASPLTKKAKLIVGGEGADWAQEEIDLLKKLVEQYQDSEYMLYTREEMQFLQLPLTICCCYFAF